MLVCALPAHASPSIRRPECGRLSHRPHAELSCARHEARLARRHPLPHSRGYWRWREKVANRWMSGARYRIAHPPIAHEALWVCIHAGEGAWNDEDSGHSGHFGGLQMTYGWDGLVTDAAQLSPYLQMRAAETGYRWSGYSFSWLQQQWWHPECFRYA